jgi:hypothetical protein
VLCRRKSQSATDQAGESCVSSLKPALWSASRRVAWAVPFSIWAGWEESVELGNMLRIWLRYE